MSSTKVLWGQLCVALGIVLVTIWAATQWVAWKLGFQPRLGQPLFVLVGGMPVYYPPAFFWWWLVYDAYAPRIFMQGACIAASGGILATAMAFAMSIWRAREAKTTATYGSARWAAASEIRAAGLMGPDGVVLGRSGCHYLRHNGPEHVLCFAPTRSGKVHQTFIVETALTSFLSPDSSEKMEAALGKRLDRLARQVERLERHVTISNEAIALFVRFWLTATSPVPDAALPAAQARGRERYERFVEALARRLARGQGLAQEISQDAEPQRQSSEPGSA